MVKKSNSEPIIVMQEIQATERPLFLRCYQVSLPLTALSRTFQPVRQPVAYFKTTPLFIGSLAADEYYIGTDLNRPETFIFVLKLSLIF
jgi:hypothetical protein